MGTRTNRLNEAVLTCTHNLCFEQKSEKVKNSTENCHFYSREKSLYIAWACFRNVLNVPLFSTSGAFAFEGGGVVNQGRGCLRFSLFP